ncbi:MAG: translation initiation factor IF-3 [Elusimicrobiales bacterium]|nr:translation initiation factor IF-3 [Elusimicrobiales bacterium]
MLYNDKRIRINRNINVPQVRLIDQNGVMVGIRATYEAAAMARNAGLDLVEIAPTAKPPVCKIMDFSKFLYEKDKQERENRKKQKSGGLKEIRLNPRIGENDLQTKIRQMEKFLQERNKVRVTVVFRGRENQHKELGEDILNRICESLKESGAQEGKSQLLGNRMSITIAPQSSGKSQSKPQNSPKIVQSSAAKELEA